MAETLSGAAVGRRKPKQLARVIRICLVWGLVGSLLYMAVFALTGSSLIRLLTDQVAIAELADRHLMWVVLASLVSMPAYLYDGVFIGATRTQPLMFIMLGSSLCFLELSAVLLPALGNHGLWLSFIVFNGLRGAGLALAARPLILKPLMDSANHQP